MMLHVMEGNVAWVFPDDFDADEIVGPEHMRTVDLEVLRSVCMSAFTADFADRFHPGDFLVAGRNFGYGHTHDQPMMIMRHLGVAAVVAESFAPMFVRSETYNGMKMLACPGIADAVRTGDRIAVTWPEVSVHVNRTGATLEGEPLAPEAIEMVEAGGGAALLRRRMGMSVAN